MEWSPDGKWIAFVHIESNGWDQKRNVFVVKADGSELTQVTDYQWHEGDAANLDWSPDGSKIAYASTYGISDIDNTSDLYVVDVSSLTR